MKRSIVILFAFAIGVTQSFSQGKAKIIIKKNIDGEETVIEKEYDLEEGQDLNDVLREEEMEMEFDFNDDMMSSFFHFDLDDEGGHSMFNGSMHGDGPFLGITQAHGDDVAGVRVSTVIEESSAEAMGIEAGDVILGFNDSDIYDMEDLRRVIAETEVGDEVKIEIERDGKRKKLKGKLLESPSSGQGMNMFRMGPEQGFDFDMESQMDMSQLEDMMRMMEERMRGMEHSFQMPREHGDQMEREYEFRYDVPGDYSDNSGSSLRFDLVTAEDLDEIDPKTALSNADDLELQELRFLPLGGSSVFELQFSTKAEEDLSLTIYDADGKMVYYEMLGDFSGEYENVIDLNDRPVGDYYLQIAQDGKTFSRKVIK